jgi:hypothetical protein
MQRSVCIGWRISIGVLPVAVFRGFPAIWSSLWRSIRRFRKNVKKKYLLWVGKTKGHARKYKPFDASDKAKKLAGWVSKRWPWWLQAEIPEGKKAA